MSEDGKVSLIKDLRTGCKNISLVFIVIEISKPTKTKDGHEIRTVRVADKSGSVNMTVWDDYGAQLQCGDIIRFTKGYAQVWKNQLTLYMGRIGSIEKIGEFCMLFSELPNISDHNTDFFPQGQPQTQPKIGEKRPADSQQIGAPPPPPPPLSNPTNNAKFNKIDPRLARRQSNDLKQAPSDPRQRGTASKQALVNANRDPRRR